MDSEESADSVADSESVTTLLKTRFFGLQCLQQFHNFSCIQYFGNNSHTLSFILNHEVERAQYNSSLNSSLSH